MEGDIALFFISGGQDAEVSTEKLLGSRSFLILFFSLCAITLVPTVFLLANLLGAPQISLSPAWYYYGDLGSLVGNPLRIVKSLVLMFLLPLSCSIPYAASFYDDMADGAYLSLYARGGKYKYWGAGILLTFGSAFFLFLVPMLLSQLLLCIAVPLDSLKLFPSYPLGEEPGFTILRCGAAFYPPSLPVFSGVRGDSGAVRRPSLRRVLRLVASVPQEASVHRVHPRTLRHYFGFSSFLFGAYGHDGV